MDHEIDVRIKTDIRRKVEAPIVKDTPDSVDRKVKVMYQKCQDVDAIERLGGGPLLDVINAMGGWALNGKTSSHINYYTQLQLIRLINHNYYITSTLIQVITILVHDWWRGLGCCSYSGLW